MGEALRKVLTQTGYEVMLAADGEQGVWCLERQPFDLVVLDLDLPKLSGWDVLDVARELYPLLPVIVLTGFFGQCVPGSLEGADAVMEKPPDVAGLLKKIAELLSEPAEKRLQRKSRQPSQAAGLRSQQEAFRRLPW